jgi:predicted MFS family arabinose efflux permease
MGGAMATSPPAAAVTGFGWRACFIFVSCIGIANLVISSMVLRPDPASHSERTMKSVLASSGRTLAHRANWGCEMSFASHFAAVTTLAGVWGIPMVAHVFKISPSAAGAPLLAFIPSSSQKG